MLKFAEQNRRLLQNYYLISRIVGWAMLGLGVFQEIGLIIYTFQTFGNSEPLMLKAQPELFFGTFCPGFLALGVARFIRFLYDSEYQPGFILRHLDKGLYLYALFLIGRGAVSAGFLSGTDFFQGQPGGSFIFGMSQELAHHVVLILNLSLDVLLPLAAKVLILIGIAQLVKRLIPIIEESKSLV